MSGGYDLGYLLSADGGWTIRYAAMGRLTTQGTHDHWYLSFIIIHYHSIIPDILISFRNFNFRNANSCPGDVNKNTGTPNTPKLISLGPSE